MAVGGAVCVLDYFLQFYFLQRLVSGEVRSRNPISSCNILLVSLLRIRLIQARLHTSLAQRSCSMPTTPRELSDGWIINAGIQAAHWSEALCLCSRV